MAHNKRTGVDTELITRLCTLISREGIHVEVERIVQIMHLTVPDSLWTERVLRSQIRGRNLYVSNRGQWASDHLLDELAQPTLPIACIT